MNGDLDPAATALEGADLFRSNLQLIDRVIARVCRVAGVRDADADDFASAVKVALIENDYSIVRAWQRRSSLATYLTVVVQRLLSDERMRARGRWEPSAAARRGGPAAVLLETIVRRDGQSIEQALPLVQAIDPSLGRAEMESMLAGVPERVSRPRPMPLDVADLSNVSAGDMADTMLMEKETERLSLETSRVVRSALASMTAEDRAIVRSHFGTGMSIADIARMLRLPQRPLYRRLESITAHLRRALISSGIDTRTAGSLIGSSVQALDFGLDSGKTLYAPQSDEGGGPAETGAAP
jgi:RNA polymerase sigma factor for flagellar operon FliA